MQCRRAFSRIRLEYPLRIRRAFYSGLTVQPCALLLHVLFNVYLHPLRGYPGPWLWAATRLPWCWYQFHGTLNQKLLALHEQYGQVVRVAPNELSFTTATAWKAIYGPRSDEMPKDPVFSLLTPTGVPNILTADRATHTRHRRLLSHAFSEKALREQNGIIEGYVKQLITQLSRRANDGPLNLSQWFTYFAYDVIRDLSFGEPCTCLETGTPDAFVSSLPSISKELILFQMLKYYRLTWLRRLFMPTSVSGARARNIARVVDTVTRRTERRTDRKDFLHYILAAMETEKSISREEINVNAFSFSIAGSEATATALAALVFYICTHPRVYRVLVAEIRDRFAHNAKVTLATVNELPYLNAVLTEVLRIHPPVAITLPRVVPSTGVFLNGRFIPPGTTVGVNHFSTYRASRNFHRPGDFVPERWLVDRPAEFENDARDAFQPFSFGPRNCLGRNLAWAEMRMVAVRLLLGFDLSLVGCERWDEQRIWGFWVKTPLWVQLREVSCVE
ncbi:benzoate 4-monooxygenase cytochrome P450 [Aspergillus steynii IBT 23096]|uniref:Benzoate 4-monooxygenase cytochrome P450 n=1 Tax=Aspergillus steynii IBT 23096 TaxID=1392250 RepID=A0A2I2G407_9EURO|nr:benzoate 4-monooxygenase cytochrome P450 [Aspergillus steynii IBT 23096]PLB47616.1 benzoate 4-monooxygenase cytochrome P450 [Aspergillus steynii IBT 23096]